ncbi:MAG: iron ABC transporter permease [Coriobacteriia bacterium]|nr:iron ABC transporter permease [Coriobacteriia bacterium]
MARQLTDRYSHSSEYLQKRRKNILFLLTLFIVLLLAVLFSLWLGSYNTPFYEIIRALFGLASDQKINLIVQDNRMPRVLTAVFSGAGLGISGCVLQSILRNPLASSSTLGVSQGASFGAAFAIIVLNMGELGVLGSLSIPLSAFVGSLLVALLILALSRLRSITPESIILAGVAISAMFTGATALMQYFASEVELTTLVFWTFGSLGNTTNADVLQLSFVVLSLSAYFMFNRWNYNALTSDEHTAMSLGINVRNFTLINLLLSCLIASLVVSKIGLINFIGLIAPHIVRLAVGNNHVYLLPGSMMAGALLLLLGDLFSRMVLSPIILPIGAITSFLGGPMFLYLLLKGGHKQ